MATGTGKTLVAAEIIEQYARVIRERYDRRVSVLFLVDRDALEVQAAELLGASLRDLKANTIDAVGHGSVDVLVAQVATSGYDRNGGSDLREEVPWPRVAVSCEERA